MGKLEGKSPSGFFVAYAQEDGTNGTGPGRMESISHSNEQIEQPAIIVSKRGSGIPGFRPFIFDSADLNLFLFGILFALKTGKEGKELNTGNLIPDLVIGVQPGAAQVILRPGLDIHSHMGISKAFF